MSRDKLDLVLTAAPKPKWNLPSGRRIEYLGHGDEKDFFPPTVFVRFHCAILNERQYVAAGTDILYVPTFDAVNQILSSIAMEELGLSHILNAEGEKMQYILGTLPGLSGPAATVKDVLNANESVRSLLETAVQNQLFLKAKMQGA